MGPSMTQLKPSQTVEEGLVLYRNIFREMQKQKSQIEIMMYFSTKLHCMCLPLLPPLPSFLPLQPEKGRPTPPLPPTPPQPIQCEGDEDGDLIITHFRLNSK